MGPRVIMHFKLQSRMVDFVRVTEIFRGRSF